MYAVDHISKPVRFREVIVKKSASGLGMWVRAMVFGNSSRFPVRLGGVETRSGVAVQGGVTFFLLKNTALLYYDACKCFV